MKDFNWGGRNRYDEKVLWRKAEAWDRFLGQWSQEFGRLFFVEEKARAFDEFCHRVKNEGHLLENMLEQAHEQAVKNVL